MPSPSELLAAPRGRRLCLEVALAAEPAVVPAVFDAERAFHGEGVAVLRFGAGADEPLPPPTGLADAGRALGGIRAESIDAVAADDTRVLECLASTVDSATYWQAPDARDELAAQPEVAEALIAVADRLVAHHLLARWSGSSFGSGWRVEFDADASATLAFTNPDAVLEQWRGETHSDEAHARVADAQGRAGSMTSGTWWSFPTCLPTASDTFADVPCGLTLVEDSLGWERALVSPTRGAGRVLDIDEATWVELCRRHPVDVTSSRRHDWGRATGREGRWVIPDWSAVAQEWNAVRLSIAQYLVLAGRPLPVDDECASLIAGWGPGVTRWLTDGVRVVGEPEVWVRSDASQVAGWARAGRPQA
ncbi:hypothetical protein H4J02_04235 [Protaetiibacter sp. SSC-01]|uniref:hypothetical protein n=1 Tax=Protaetiibacter sp. SSC-01 TaxID=2759943 RepID=UPI001656E323|nr:hypothetical protein [Protaetiibacter sp. SSC-01]QNO38242.1 hypothetical protein H4J02_04235 [Protaetiibacter sp. SSC-01]